METILITGASSGIGEAVATVFADRGWNVIATMRNPSAESRLAARENVLVTRLDVQDANTITEAIAVGVAHFGGIDILINNAGMNVSGVFEETPTQKVHEIFGVNVFGVLDMTRAILPHFRERKAGVIVNVSSAAGIVALPLGSLYQATKFALEGFSESLSYELLAQNIVVKLVEPGLVKTGMTDSWLTQIAPNAIDDYQTYTTALTELYGSMMNGEVPEAATVAERIFEAATDGTDRLRYIVTDGAAEQIKPRYALPEAEYIKTMRAMLQPKTTER